MGEYSEDLGAFCQGVVRDREAPRRGLPGPSPALRRSWELREQVRGLAGQIAALQGELVGVVAEYMEVTPDLGAGWRSRSHRLGYELGFTSADARRVVRVAERLDELPALADAVVDGRANLAVAASIAEVATPAIEAEVGASGKASSTAPTTADGLVAMAHDTLTATEAASGGVASDRYRVIIRADADLDTGQLVGVCTADGAQLTPPEVQAVLDDVSALVTVSSRGRPVWITDPARTPPAWMRRQVLTRDRHTCRFPGCEHAGPVELHHVIERTDHGPTTVTNLVCLCWFHHRALHRAHGRLETLDDNRWRFTAGDGTTIDPTPGPAPPPDRAPPTGTGPPQRTSSPLTDDALDVILHHLFTTRHTADTTDAAA